MPDLPVMLDAARDLADLGYPVFPCRAGGKMPLVVHGFKQATRDERTILHWWDRWPDANVAVACGAAGIAVVDIDARHGADPAQVIAGLPVNRDTLVAAWTGVAPAPSSQHPESLEGMRGMHLFFRDDSARTGPLNTDGVELRAVGSYVIAAPSLHPSGVRYAWHRRDLPPRPRQLPPLPPALRPRPSPERSAGAGVLLEGTTYAQGRRHQAIRDLAIDTMRRGIASSDLLGGLLRAANASRCRPPLPDDEVQRIIAWASQSELAQMANTTPLILEQHRGRYGES